METYHGHVRTPADAIILFEACRIGLLPRVQRRLSEKERQQIKSGSVFVWDEREAGMRRWTDGKSWSASRVSGSFLTYREMEGKRGGGSNGYIPDKKRPSGKSPDGSATGDSEGEGPDGYRYKPDGLMKQSFSITTSQGQHLHLISYFSRSSPAANNLQQPTTDPQLRHIRPPKQMYPESSVNETATVPPMTRTPMPGSPYPQPPPQATASPSPYAAPHRSPHAVMVYPPTPPYGYQLYPSPLAVGYPQVYFAPPGYPHQGMNGLAPQHAPHAYFAQPQPHFVPNIPQRSPQPLEHLQQSAQAPAPQPPQPPSHRVPSVSVTLPEPGPQLPAINGAIAKPSSPQPSENKTKESAAAESTDTGASTRNVPSINTLLNETSANTQNNSRSGSRSPGNNQRPLPPMATGMATHSSATAVSENAINKLNSTFR
ncbi:hypothetical protein BU24DRAFT_453767 [Aaosphaeria arxii CBS 175.79]|uniref:Camp-independent regulatory protein pac2 n=1 Tax=Aaosphaeria arxii CBS 175.79 TaxID=1450172 RepID=A0A6A5XH00_9PLEO|nr:uncharacterized protein BU24DRAFT_453767 [Aaosphaeria arxii CBS 175.79]KAF2012362.1 hypothetical protein BU24DRAFT_453767 [Aaosphaeria arxii CBS 175.79]